MSIFFWLQNVLDALTLVCSFFEVPSNIVLKLMRPSVWIALIMFAWGLVVR